MYRIDYKDGQFEATHSSLPGDVGTGDTPSAALTDLLNSHPEMLTPIKGAMEALDAALTKVAAR